MFHIFFHNCKVWSCISGSTQDHSGTEPHRNEMKKYSFSIQLVILGIRRNVCFLFKLFPYYAPHLHMESTFIAAVCSGYLRRWKHIRMISPAHMCISIVFANTSTASSDTIMKPLICLTTLRQYTDGNFLLVDPKDNITYIYIPIDLVTLDIILLFIGFGPPMFAQSLSVRLGL